MASQTNYAKPESRGFYVGYKKRRVTAIRDFPVAWGTSARLDTQSRLFADCETEPSFYSHSNSDDLLASNDLVDEFRHKKPRVFAIRDFPEGCGRVETLIPRTFVDSETEPSLNSHSNSDDSIDSNDLVEFRHNKPRVFAIRDFPEGCGRVETLIPRTFVESETEPSLGSVLESEGESPDDDVVSPFDLMPKGLVRRSSKAFKVIRDFPILSGRLSTNRIESETPEEDDEVTSKMESIDEWEKANFEDEPVSIGWEKEPETKLPFNSSKPDDVEPELSFISMYNISLESLGFSSGESILMPNIGSMDSTKKPETLESEHELDDAEESCSSYSISNSNTFKASGQLGKEPSIKEEEERVPKYNQGQKQNQKKED
ncbi:hypothetical protein COLO4_37222 [Corchorus olitorius]|uniref:Uncharacterized protein n=1 Tax=Corchorus olitorius TaxID=93759 RepID=A0A1R3G2V0_9ROSI|nr:hypothetical protein COLO4_37222 [Corchorus olitorius]